MCTNPDKFWIGKKEFSLEYLLNKIDRFYRGENEFLENYRGRFSLSGGEPTLSSHIKTLIKKINNLFPGIKITCLSNGRMFFYEDYAKRFLQSDIDLELAISLHGHDAKIHDKITRTKGSFNQTIKGLYNILRFKKKNHTIELRIVIHQLNYKFLRKIAKFIQDKFSSIDRLVFIFFEIEGQAYRNINVLKLTYHQLLPYISEMYSFIHYFPKIRFYHFPLCTLPIKFFPYIFRTLPDYEVSFPDNCIRCNLKNFCAGIHKGYLKYFGSEEFSPINTKIDIRKSNNWYCPIAKAEII